MVVPQLLAHNASNRSFGVTEENHLVFVPGAGIETCTGIVKYHAEKDFQLAVI
jgi:hypothetical protein